MPQWKKRRFRRQQRDRQLSQPEVPAAEEKPQPLSTRRDFLTMFFPKGLIKENNEKP
jgi:hypothetical protein